MSEKVVIVRERRWRRDPQVDKAILVVLGIVGAGFLLYMATDGCRSSEKHEPTRDEAIKLRREYAAGTGRHARIKRATAAGLGAEDLVIEAAEPPCDDAFLNELATNGELGRRRYFTVRCGDGAKVIVDWNEP